MMKPSAKQSLDKNGGSLLATTPRARSPQAAAAKALSPKATPLQLLHWTPVVALLALGLVVLLGGCSALPERIEVAVRTEAVADPRHVPVNHLGVLALPPELRRVVLLPVSGGEIISPETAASLDPVFVAALQRRMRFEVVPVSRAWCRRYFGAGDFSSASALPHDFLGRLGREHAADAVLFVDVTAYRDHRPQVFGVRAKLALIDGPRMLWSYDEILSAEDPAVAAGAQDHARAAAPAGVPANFGHAALQSPSRFAAYVADTVFGTLPER